MRALGDFVADIIELKCVGGSDIMLQSAILCFSWVFTIIRNKSGWGEVFYWRLDDLIMMR